MHVQAKNKLKICIFAGSLGLSTTPGAALLAAEGKTVVTTYITTVQEERESTRFTLTEWLRIKERMKMMDVWLAMFSDPKKDHFSPELNLQYMQLRGRMTQTSSSLGDESSALRSQQLRAQLWLTNLITGTVGIRALNIDFGIEAHQQSSGDFSVENAADAGVSRKLINRYTAANLRLFGRNIQDSSLVIKYGQYSRDDGVAPLDVEGASPSYRGLMAGAELQLYVFKWLGAEAHYQSYGSKTKALGDDSIRGSYSDYLAYIEISLLRLMLGRYEERWHRFDAAQGAVDTKDSGLLAGVKLQF